MHSRRQFIATGAALALAGSRTAQAAEADDSTPEVLVQPEWETGPSDRYGIASPAMEGLLQAGVDTPGLRSLLVVRDGVLIGERYYRGASPDEPQPINSVTKSISSMLVGLALERGTIAGLDEPVRRLLPEAAARVPDSALGPVRLGDILAGRSGLSFDVFRSGELLASPDPVRFALDLPRTPPPPSGWTYNDPVVGLLSPMLARAERRNLAAIAARDLFAPLGIRRYEWWRDKLDQPLAYGGLVLRTRDLAKLTWTMCDAGRWRGRQVVPPQWAAHSTTPQGPADWRLPPVQDIGYGYLWFTGMLHGQRVAWGWGYGGQCALLAPALRLAIVTAATSPPRNQLAVQMGSIMALVGRLVSAAG
jgi:CubicO group peptidase (beta-lactamase class C family)